MVGINRPYHLSAKVKVNGKILLCILFLLLSPLPRGVHVPSGQDAKYLFPVKIPLINWVQALGT